jgi:hypothetical protein
LSAADRQPGAGLALGLGDFARVHFDADLGTAVLRAGVARQCRQIEPFVGFDEVDGDAASPGRVGHAKLVQGLDIAPRRVGEPTAEKEIGTFLTDCHVTASPVFVLGEQFTSQAL